MLTKAHAVAVSVFLAILIMPLAHGQQTILVANFMNGNNAALNSRVYLWNPSNTAGDITVRVFTLPLRSGFPQELTGAPFNLGALGSKAAVNLKLAEDILVPLGISTPYVTDGGNLTLEFTIGSDNVRGVAQVFSGDFAFGTYPLLDTTGGVIGSAQLADQVDFGATGSRGFVRMLNSTGTVVTELGATSIDAGLLNLYGSTGSTVASLGASSGNDGILNLQSSTGNTVATLGTSTSNPNTGALVLRNSEGNGTVTLQSINDSGNVSISDSTGNPVVAMGNTDLGVGIGVRQGNPDQTVAVVFGDSESRTLGGMFGGNLPVFGQSAAFFTVDPDTQQTVSVIGGNRNVGGRVEVYNFFGTRTAGMHGDSGLVFGNVKSFIVADPSDSNRMIKYTSLEGPEAAIYVRGTANLVSGRAYIDFPDHFSAMAVPSSITVTLTPRSARSMGLASVNVSSQGIEVAELGGGRNSYAFDYVAHAVRKGYEDYEVYLTKEQASELTASSMVKALSPVKSKKALE